MIEYIDLTRALLGLIAFTIASYADYRTRQIENDVWLFGGAIASFLLFLHLYAINAPPIAYLLSFLAVLLFFTPYISLERFGIEEKIEVYIEFFLYFLLTALTIGLGLYWFVPENGIPIGIVAMQVLFRLFYELNIIHGGADAKALMFIAILFPTYPHIYAFPIAKPLLPIFEAMFPFALTVLLNAVFWFIFYPLVLLIYNLRKGNAKFPNALFGYKLPIKEVKNKFVWLMEHPVDGKIVTRLSPAKDEDENIAREIAELERMGKKEVWVTPQIPFIIPITVGLVISIIVGNVFFILLGVCTFCTAARLNGYI